MWHRHFSACGIGSFKYVAQALLPVPAAVGRSRQLQRLNIVAKHRACKSGLERSDIKDDTRRRGPCRRAARIKAEDVSQDRHCKSGLERSDINNGLSTDRRTTATQEIAARIRRARNPSQRDEVG